MAYGRGKLGRYHVLAGSPDLASSLPKTRVMNKQNFWAFLGRFGTVIVKPAFGSGGVGVVQVSSEGNDTYEVHYGRNKKKLRGRQAAYAFVHGLTRRSPCIVQQKIPLAIVNGRPFDVRVMVQRRRDSGWSVTGKLAKIAGVGFIVTNYRFSNGAVVPLPSAIKKSNIRGISEKSIQTQIDRTALHAVKRLQPFYRIDTVGVDMGLDARGKAWIIETNFNPLKSLFLRLKDKTIYRHIMSYARR